MPRMDKFDPLKHGYSSTLGRQEILSLIGKERGLSLDVLEMATVENEGARIKALAFMEHSEVFLKRCMDAAAMLACAFSNPEATLRPHIHSILTATTDEKKVPPGTDLEVIAESLDGGAIRRRFSVRIFRRDTAEEIARNHIEVDPFAVATYSPYEKNPGKISRGKI